MAYIGRVLLYRRAMHPWIRKRGCRFQAGANGNTRFAPFFFASKLPTPKDVFVYGRCGGKKKGKKCFLFCFVVFFTRRNSLSFTLQNRQKTCRSKTSSPCDHRPTISRHRITHGHTASCGTRSANVNDGLEHSTTTPGLGGEWLSAASCTLRLNLKKCSCFATRVEECSREKLFGYQTPIRRPPHIAGRRVNNTVILGWVEAPINDRARFTFYDAVLGFVHGCMSRTNKISLRSKTHFAEFLSSR